MQSKYGPMGDLLIVKGRPSVLVLRPGPKIFFLLFLLYKDPIFFFLVAVLFFITPWSVFFFFTKTKKNKILLAI